MNKIFLLLKFILDVIANLFTKRKIILISERADWVIKEECKNVENFLNTHTNIKARESATTTGARNKIVHFFSVNTFIDENGIRNKGIFQE